MKDVKSLLKEAREAIKNKDFQVSLKICKNVLKLDKDNYMGLVFFGLSGQETGSPADQIVKAFRKAIKLNPENILAWNGLMNYYESQKQDPNELLDVYVTMLKLETNEKKVVEICEKITNTNCFSTEVFDTMLSLSKLETYKEDTRIAIVELLVKVGSNKPDLADRYEELLKTLISNPKSISSTYYLEYFKVLHKKQKDEELLKEAQIMYEKLENATALEWICKIYNEFSIEDQQLSAEISAKIHEYSDLLLNRDNSSSMALFTKAVIHFNNRNVLESKDLLLEVLENRSGLLHGWYLLSKCYEDLEIFDKALESINKADKLLKSIQDSNKIMRIKVDQTMMHVLSYQTTNEALELAETRIKDALELNPNCVEYLTCLVRVYINKKQSKAAEEFLSKLKSLEIDKEVNVDLLEAQLLIQTGKLQDALSKLLKMNVVDDYEYFKTLGFLYWKLEQFEKALIPFLKAVKLKQYSSFCFLYLGHYYKLVDNLDKARRCYEKAFNLNMDCIEAGVELTKIYRNDKNWEANLTLLENVTAGKLNATNDWAYLQLGLHYLEQESFTKAIDSLRYIVRLQPNNSHFWETLGDAYFARGSFTSALKSYNKASELTVNNSYALLQIANIKLLLQEYKEAREDFLKILAINGKYLPALKGLAETCLKQADVYRTNQLFGLSRDYAQAALENATIALRERPDMSCLWKIAADSCFLTTKLPDRYSCLLVLTALAEGKEVTGNKALEREDLFILSARCYCRALKLVQENGSLLWHDLGACYLAHAQFSDDDRFKAELYDKAFACAKFCVENNSQHWPHWNLLGNVAFHKEPKNYALAQHAFIKAVTLEQDSAISWCNLGALYLHLHNLPLANKAFSQAQRSDPNYVNSWIGQALIAETLNREEAMDLFRHSMQLRYHPEGAIGYANWVCKTLLKNPPNKIIYAIHNMHAVPVAHDAMTWYTEGNLEDGCAWNILGILSERIGLKTVPATVFKKATIFCEKDLRDKANTNYGRSLMRIGKYSDSIDRFKTIKEATFNSGIGLALSLFKAQQYEESYGTYEAVLDWLTEEKIHQSDLMVALASMAVLFQKSEDAKQILLKSTLLKPPSPWALYATLSFGLLYNDLNLAVLVLKELKQLENDQTCLAHYATLLSCTYLLLGENRKAVVELSKLIHKYPDQASVWYQLAILLLRLKDVSKYKVAAKCAQATMNLGRNTTDVTKVLCLVSLASYLAGDAKKAVIFAQKATICYPNAPETWATLLYSTDNINKREKLASFVRIAMKPSDALSDWLATNCR